MEIFNYCNQCKKSLNCDNFDKKKNGDYYTRCKVCRINHNENEKNKYIKKICSGRNLCNDINCDECLNKSFASYDGKTENGKLKIDCWHPTKNGNVKPRDITKGTYKKFWFICDKCNHYFNSSLQNICKNKWCSYCNNKKLCIDKNCMICFKKSFGSYNGKTINGKLKVKCWNLVKNKNLNSRDIFKNSGKKYWFQCDNCGHDFDKSLNSIVGNNGWCPYCCNQKICIDKNCKICFEKSFASYKGKTTNGKLKINCWHPTKNKGLIPRDIFKFSNKKFWFKCDECNHDINKNISNIVSKNRWCPFCSIPTQKICNKKSCIYCFESSFASYNGKTTNGKLKINCWHSTKNGKLTPRSLIKRSIKKCWFQCDNCPHSFISSIDNIISNSWCPYCCTPSKQFCDDKNCNYCFEKSFASYKGKTMNDKLKIDCWHPTKNGKNKPSNIFKSSGKKYWFQCDKCPHSFEKVLASVFIGIWCPYCCIPSKQFCNDKNCNHCFEKSFASYDEKTINGKLKIDCWHPTKNGKNKPLNVFKSSGKKYWFQCDMCHNSFETRPNHVTGKNSWCPNCKNKTELKLYNWLLEQDCIEDVKKEYKPTWCSTQFRHINKKKVSKNGKYQYRYDFLITFKNNKKLIIELDGAQHFKQVMNWKTPLENQIRDKYKEFLAKKHKIPLTRCIQEDVYMDRNNWEQKLKRKLKKYN